MTYTSNKQTVDTELVNNVIAAAEVAEMAGFTGEQSGNIVKDIVMEMAGISETEATAVIQEARRQMAAGPGKLTVAERLGQKMAHNVKYEKTLLVLPQDEDRAILSDFIMTLEVDGDTAYDETSAALDAIAEEGLEQVKSELGYHCDTADDYTHDLLSWAQKNLHWCDKIIDEGITGRTFAEAIRAAQVKAKEYVWEKVVEWVRELEEEERE